MQDLLIYGNGKIAQILYFYLENEYNVLGFTVEENLINEKSIDGKEIYSFEKIEEAFEIDKTKMIVCIGYHEMNKVRARIFNEAKNKGFDFINYIHPNVTIPRNVEMGINNIVLENSSIQPFTKIGDNNMFWANTVLAHGSSVQNNNWITSGVVVSGDTKIGSNNFIGVNSTIGHNIEIANSNFIGASSLITRSTKDDEVFIVRDTEKYRLDSHRFIKFAGI